MKISVDIQNKGSISKWLQSVNDKDFSGILTPIGEQGVQQLSMTTPVDSGLLASGWDYVVEKEPSRISLSWFNTGHSNMGTLNLARMLYYGHGTGTGGYVPGRDYITPAMAEIFDSSFLDNLIKELINSG